MGQGSEYWQDVVRRTEAQRLGVLGDVSRLQKELDLLAGGNVAARLKVQADLGVQSQALRFLDKDLQDARAKLKDAQVGDGARAAEAQLLRAKGDKVFAKLARDFAAVEGDLDVLLDLRSQLTALGGFVPWLIPAVLVEGVRGARYAWRLADALRNAGR